MPVLVWFVFFLFYLPGSEQASTGMEVMSYLHRGTLHKSGSSHIRECSSSSCHMRLQWTHPPGTRVLQLEKWRTKASSPLQAVKLQGTWLPFSTLSRGPIVLHPSPHMWRRASIASWSCKYTFLSSIFLNLSCFLWNQNETKIGDKRHQHFRNSMTPDYLICLAIINGNFWTQFARKRIKHLTSKWYWFHI